MIGMGLDGIRKLLILCKSTTLIHCGATTRLAATLR
jgi:hypothetical protein